jgi:AraC-like DNA-binding protein
MVQQWRVLSAHYSEKPPTAENQTGSYPRPGVGDQVIDHTNSGTLRVKTEIRTGVKPIQAKGRQVQALQKWRLKRVVEYIDNHLSEKITLSGLGAVAGLSPMHFASQFRMATSLRPHEFVLHQRVRRARALLQNSTKPITEIAPAVGFQTQAHFTTVFRRIVGITPHRWRGQSAPNARNAGRAEASVPASGGFGSAQCMVQFLRQSPREISECPRKPGCRIVPKAIRTSADFASRSRRTLR